MNGDDDVPPLLCLGDKLPRQRRDRHQPLPLVVGYSGKGHVVGRSVVVAAVANVGADAGAVGLDGVVAGVKENVAVDCGVVVASDVVVGAIVGDAIVVASIQPTLMGVIERLMRPPPLQLQRQLL